MIESRWQALERLFDAGLAVDPAARERWLLEQPIDDGLRAEVRAMLDAESESDAIARSFGDTLCAAVDAPLPGMRLGAYRLLHELGSGGMGHVYLAERADDQFRQQVAIKLIRGFASADAVQQLRHERQILAELVHPNIARLLDGGETQQGQPYLVMEYVPGLPITEACAAQSLPMARRIALVRDLAHAVHYAHQRLIVHRDIKPANVLLREDGRPLLLDFGIAKLVDPESQTAATATQPWFTPAYASPEQRNGLPLSTATDVYALGLLLFELLVDQPPSLDAGGVLPPPSQAAPPARRRALRGDLDRIVQRATAEEAGRRYSSAEAFADDLQRYLVGAAVLAVPDSLRYRFGKLVRRHPYVSVAAVCAAGLLAFSTWRLARERDHALRAEVQAQAAQAAAQREAQAAGAVTAYLVDLFREADPERARGASITPSLLIDRGVERLAGAADVPANQRARLLGAFGEIYVNMGLPEKATHALAAALETASQVPGALTPEQRAALLEHSALAAESRQRFEDNERFFREAVAIYRSIDAPDKLAEALSGLGLAIARNSDDDDVAAEAEAERVLREAIALQTRRHGADSPLTLRSQVSLAEVMFLAGQQAEARQLMDASIAGLRAQLAADDFDLIAALGFYGVMLRDTGDNDGAEKVFLEILAQRKSLLEQNSQRIALVHNNLGRVYYNRGETLKAVEQFRAVYDIGSSRDGEDDPSRALDLVNLASLYEEVGDYVSAEPLMREGAMMLERDPDGVPLLALGRQNFGRLLMLAGKKDEARLWLEKPLGDAGDTRIAMERGRQRIHLAEWHRRYGDPAQAHRWLREAMANLDDIGGPESPRIAAIERIQGLLAAAEGDRGAARTLLESARERQIAARSARYIGVGDLSLDLAELAWAGGDRSSARQELARARDILEPQLAHSAPQRARLAALDRKLR